MLDISFGKQFCSILLCSLHRSACGGGGGIETVGDGGVSAVTCLSKGNHRQHTISRCFFYSVFTHPATTTLSEAFNTDVLEIGKAFGKLFFNYQTQSTMFCLQATTKVFLELLVGWVFNSGGGCKVQQ